MVLAGRPVTPAPCAEFRLLMAQMTVSYTHLDVYKRQLYLIPAAVLGITGPGSYSLDSLFGITLPEPVTGIVAAALAVAGVAVGMAGRRPAAEQVSEQLAA